MVKYRLKLFKIRYGFLSHEQEKPQILVGDVFGSRVMRDLPHDVAVHLLAQIFFALPGQLLRILLGVVAVVRIYLVRLQSLRFCFYF